ncbi:MAG: type II toxin-antitoxin system VapC family toxin [Acidimicrobiia bacterium]|nr:type II toxin-antitoxin system VapC family toxin [Acidimicrobiia bacterium]
MSLLLDTHVLLWASATPDRLKPEVRRMIEDMSQQILYSAASIWEVAIKGGLGRADLQVDPRLLRRGLLEHGYDELAVTGVHAAAVDQLPPIHKDPFDRLLVAQAQIEAVTLLTADRIVARYPGPIRLI